MKVGAEFMKKIHLFLISILLLFPLFMLSGCTKHYENVLNYYNDSKIVKVEYVELKKTHSEEEFIPLQIENLNSYIDEINALDCESYLMKDYYWKGSGDIKYYYEDGSTLKWDGTKAKYIDKSGEQKSKYFDNIKIWEITSKHAGIFLNLRAIVKDKENFILSKVNTKWVSENETFSISFGDATSYAYYNSTNVKETFDERTEMDKFDIVEEAFGTLKYKDSLIRVKLTFSRDKGHNDMVFTSIYYLYNIEGEEHPNLDDDNLIIKCLSMYYNSKLTLILTTYYSEVDEKFLNTFDSEEVLFIQVDNEGQ